MSHPPRGARFVRVAIFLLESIQLHVDLLCVCDGVCGLRRDPRLAQLDKMARSAVAAPARLAAPWARACALLCGRVGG